MRTFVTTISGIALLALGYAAGATGLLSQPVAYAQGEDSPAKKAKETTVPNVPELTDETKAKIKAASEALDAAVEALKIEGRYTSATKGANAFAVLTGGLNSVNDLKSGRGVDPETFSALYSDLATDAIAEKLGRDPEGRLTYNGKLVRMYPVSRLKTLYAVRSMLTGEQLVVVPEEETADPKKAKKKKKAAEPEETEESTEEQ